jgi:hypothetical protein
MVLHIDGSHHQWFQDERWHDLIVILDDSTSEIYYAQLAPEETTGAVMAGLRAVIERKRLFCSLCSDRGAHFWLTPKSGSKVDYERPTQLADRLRRLRTIPGVGPITALTWALEVGDTSRFRSIKQAISYCGLCSAEKSSANKVMRTPISKQRNKHIQHVLVEAARLAPRYSDELALLYEKERQRGNGNRATLAVARKMVALMLAVERRNTDYMPAAEFRRTAAA